MSTFPKIPIIGTKNLDEYWNRIWAGPLSTSYPASNFRANRSDPNAPGNPNYGSVTSANAGDPRAQVSGGYYGVHAGQASRDMFAALGAPKTQNIGGSQVSIGNNSIPWIPIAILIVVIYFFMRK